MDETKILLGITSILALSGLGIYFLSTDEEETINDTEIDDTTKQTKCNDDECEEDIKKPNKRNTNKTTKRHHKRSYRHY
jgi:hypothetical protein